MTKQRNNSLDGFVPRRPGAQSATELGKQSGDRFNTPRPLSTVARPSPKIVGASPIVRDELDESLKGIDLPEEGKNAKKRRGGKRKWKISRIIKWLVILIIVAGLGIGGYLAYKTLNAGGQIFKGSLLDIVQNQPLKQDANGRSNILVVGTSTDDPGHDAPFLTDSIMILSVDQTNKNAYLMSLPRDLEVKYGESCEMVGSSGKINGYYHWCADGANGDVEGDRKALTKMSGLISGLLGIDVQYGVNVNYTVMRELVGAVGGITVTIESQNPKGVLDQNFDWKCGLGDPKVSAAERLRRCPPNGHYIEYPNGPVNLDAEHALYLAQARGDCVPVGYNQCKATYGFERSNFDREINQQKIVKAIREKAMSGGVLTDFTKVSGILDALGNNLRTTFEAKEIRTLVNLAKDIQDKDIQSLSFIDAEPPLFNGNAQPAAGMYNFKDIQAYIKKKLTSNPITREEASVVVLNGSGVAGVGQKEADKLTEQGLIISNIANAPTGTYEAVEVYQIGDGKDATKAKLESLFGVTVKTTAPPAGASAGMNFVVIFGKDRSASQ